MAKLSRRLIELLRDLLFEAPCSRHEAYMRIAGRKRYGAAPSIDKEPLAEGRAKP